MSVADLAAAELAEVPGGDANQRNIEEKVDENIREIWRLLQQKKDKIADAKTLILTELEDERRKLDREEDEVTERIKGALDKLGAEKEKMDYLKQRLATERQGTAVVHLNVGGEKISSMRETLTSCPGSTLCSWFSHEFPGAKDADGACFIDRNPHIFSMILEFLRANVVPTFASQQEEVAFRKEVEYFGLTKWIFPSSLTEDAIQKIEDDLGKVTWKFRCDVSEIKKDSFYTSPDFLHEGNRWRVLFTERCSFLSLYVHNVDAGLKAATWELSKAITITLKNNDDRKSVVKTIKHTFTRRSPDIGLNYFMLMEGLRSNKGGFLVTSLPQAATAELKPEIVFTLEIQKVDDAYMGQPVHSDARVPAATPVAAKHASAKPTPGSKQASSIKAILGARRSGATPKAPTASQTSTPGVGVRRH